MATRSPTLRAPAPRRVPGRRRELLAPVDGFSLGLAHGVRQRLAAGRAAAHLGEVDGWLLVVVTALVAFGLTMVYSSTEALGYASYGNANYFFERQILFAGVGLALMVLVARIDYHRWREWSPALAIGTLVLLVLVQVPHLGVERLGAKRWIGVGPVQIEPSQIATMVGIVFFSGWLERRGPAVRTWKVVRRYTGLLIAVLLLIILQKDLGSAMVLAGAAVVLLGISGARKRGLFAAAGFLFGLGWLAVRAESFRQNRLSSFRDPFADAGNTGWQAVQSMLALGSGGLHGVGLGNSLQKYQWLPEAHTDFIYAIIGEELGLIGALSVMIGFLLLVWRGIRASMRAPDGFGALLAGGVSAWIGVQAFVNMGAVTGVIPTTGITLPFISYGGSSLVTTLIAVGVLCNISAQGRRHTEAKRAHVDRGWGDRRTPHAGDRGRQPAAAGGLGG